MSLTGLEEILPDTVTAEGDSDALNEFLGTLDEKERLMFMYKYWACSTVKEIAERFGVSERKVRMKLYRTRKKLKVFLEERRVRI